MAYNGSGVWVRLYNWTNDAANGIKIRADRMDAEFNDMCNNGLSAVLTRDGQGKPSAALPMNGFNHTGAANGTAAGQYLVYGQPQAVIGSAVTAAFGTVGVGLIGNAFTQTDNSTAVGTVASACASQLGAATFATATNAITITNAYGLYLKDPVAGANTTLTNKYALGADSLRVAGLINPVGGIVGTATNDSAAAGNVGEYVTSNASSVSLSNGSNVNVTTISLTAGDWDVSGTVKFTPSGATVTGYATAVSSTSATLPAISAGGFSGIISTALPANSSQLLPTPTYRISLSGTATIYLIAESDFTAGSIAASGYIRARRIR